MLSFVVFSFFFEKIISFHVFSCFLFLLAFLFEFFVMFLFEFFTFGQVERDVDVSVGRDTKVMELKK